MLCINNNCIYNNRAPQSLQAEHFRIPKVKCILCKLRKSHTRIYVSIIALLDQHTANKQNKEAPGLQPREGEGKGQVTAET